MTTTDANSTSSCIVIEILFHRNFRIGPLACASYASPDSHATNLPLEQVLTRSAEIPLTACVTLKTPHPAVIHPPYLGRGRPKRQVNMTNSTLERRLYFEWRRRLMQGCVEKSWNVMAGAVSNVDARRTSMFTTCGGAVGLEMMQRPT